MQAWDGGSREGLGRSSNRRESKQSCFGALRRQRKGALETASGGEPRTTRRCPLLPGCKAHGVP